MRSYLPASGVCEQLTPNLSLVYGIRPDGDAREPRPAREIDRTAETSGTIEGPADRLYGDHRTASMPSRFAGFPTRGMRPQSRVRDDEPTVALRLPHRLQVAARRLSLPVKDCVMTGR